VREADQLLEEERDKNNELNEDLQGMKAEFEEILAEAKKEKEDAQAKVNRFYDIKRFDTNFYIEAAKFHLERV